MSKKESVAGLLREVWSEGRVEAAVRCLAPLYTIHHDPGDPWRGQQLDAEGYADRVRISRAPFPDQRFDIHTLISEGDTVLATWLWSGTHAGDIPGFPASGRIIRMSGATLYYFDGERICGHWQITDRLAVYQQLQSAASERVAG